MRANKRVRFDEEQASSKKQKEHDSITPPTIENAPKPVRDGSHRFSWDYNPDGWAQQLNPLHFLDDSAKEGEEAADDLNHAGKVALTAEQIATMLFSFGVYAYKMRLQWKDPHSVAEYVTLWGSCQVMANKMKLAMTKEPSQTADIVDPATGDVRHLTYGETLGADQVTQNMYQNGSLAGIRNMHLGWMELAKPGPDGERPVVTMQQIADMADKVGEMSMYDGPRWGKSLPDHLWGGEGDKITVSDMLVRGMMPQMMATVAALAPSVLPEGWGSGARFSILLYQGYLKWGTQMPRMIADFGRLSYTVAYRARPPAWIREGLLWAEAMHKGAYQFHEQYVESTAMLGVRFGILQWAKMARRMGSDLTVADALTGVTIWAGKTAAVTAWGGASMLGRGLKYMVSGERFLTGNTTAEEQLEQIDRDTVGQELMRDGMEDPSENDIDSALEERGANPDELDDDMEEEQQGQEEQKGDEPGDDPNEGREATPEAPEAATEAPKAPEAPEAPEAPKASEAPEASEGQAMGRVGKAIDYAGKGLFLGAMLDSTLATWAPGAPGRQALHKVEMMGGKAMVFGTGVAELSKLGIGMGKAGLTAAGYMAPVTAAGEAVSAGAIAGGAVAGAATAAGTLAAGYVGLKAFDLFQQDSRSYYLEQYTNAARPDFHGDKYYKALYKGITKDYSEKTGFDYYTKGVGTTLSKERKGETEEAFKTIAETTATGATVGMTFAGVGTGVGAAAGLMTGASVAAGKEFSELIRHGSQDTTSKAYKRHLHKAVEQNVRTIGREFMSDHNCPPQMFDTYYEESGMNMNDLFDYGISDVAIYNMFVQTTSSAWSAGRQYQAWDTMMQSSMGAKGPMDPAQFDGGQSDQFLRWMTDTDSDDKSNYVGGANLSWDDNEYFTSRAEDGTVVVNMMAIPMISTSNISYGASLPELVTYQEYNLYSAAEVLSNASMLTADGSMSDEWMVFDAMTHTYFEYIKQQSANVADLPQDMAVDEQASLTDGYQTLVANFEAMVRASTFYDVESDTPWDPSDSTTWDFSYSETAKEELSKMSQEQVDELTKLMNEDLPNDGATTPTGDVNPTATSAAMHAAMDKARESVGGDANKASMVGPDADDGEDADDPDEAPTAVDQSLINLDYQAGYYDPYYSSGQGSGTSWHSSLGVSRLDVIAAVFKAGLEQRLNAMPQVGSTRGMAF